VAWIGSYSGCQLGALLISDRARTRSRYGRSESAQGLRNDEPVPDIFRDLITLGLVSLEPHALETCYHPSEQEEELMKTFLAATAVVVLGLAITTSQILPKQADVARPQPYKFAMAR
jgi:hypothetical protein